MEHIHLLVSTFDTSNVAVAHNLSPQVLLKTTPETKTKTKTRQAETKTETKTREAKTKTSKVETKTKTKTSKSGLDRSRDQDQDSRPMHIPGICEQQAFSNLTLPFQFGRKPNLLYIIKHHTSGFSIFTAVKKEMFRSFSL